MKPLCITYTFSAVSTRRTGRQSEADAQGHGSVAGFHVVKHVATAVLVLAMWPFSARNEEALPGSKAAVMTMLMPARVSARVGAIVARIWAYVGWPGRAGEPGEAKNRRGASTGERRIRITPWLQEWLAQGPCAIPRPRGGSYGRSEEVARAVIQPKIEIRREDLRALSHAHRSLSEPGGPAGACSEWRCWVLGHGPNVPATAANQGGQAPGEAGVCSQNGTCPDLATPSDTRDPVLILPRILEPA